MATPAQNGGAKVPANVSANIQQPYQFDDTQHPPEIPYLYQGPSGVIVIPPLAPYSGPLPKDRLLPFRSLAAWTDTSPSTGVPLDCGRVTKEQEEGFRRVLHRPNTAPLFYASHNDLKAAIIRGYYSRIDEAKDVLHMAISRIHISCDLWTSTNFISLLGVVAHFLDSNNLMRTILQGVPRVCGGHDGENVGASLLEVLERFGIEDNLGVFVMDNAYNNTMIRALCESIPSIQPGDRLRCAGHILNLVVKAALYRDSTSFSKNIIGAGDEESSHVWLQFGAIGRIQIVMKWIMRSDQRRQLFMKGGEENEDEITQDDQLWTSCDKLLAKDGGVRWNSTYYMLRRARELRPQIDYLQWKYKPAPGEAYTTISDRLTSRDWSEVDWFMALLCPFVKTTKHMEGNADEEGLRTWRSAL